jgi:hypothetical protein
LANLFNNIAEIKVRRVADLFPFADDLVKNENEIQERFSLK